MLCLPRVEELMAGLCRAAAEAEDVATGGLNVSLLLAGAATPREASTCISRSRIRSS
jgi:hypothetical protein